MSKRRKDYPALKAEFYAKLAAEGFQDIEYGQENPRFTAGTVDAAAPDVDAKTEYYARIWQVAHAWAAAGRSKRDVRLVELYASQQGNTGTIRGISRTLKSEGLKPWSTSCVQITLREIRAQAKNIETPMDTLPYVSHRHART